MSQGKHLRQFRYQKSLHDRSRYSIKHAGRAVAFDELFSMGDECSRIAKQAHQTLQHDQISTGDVALLGNPVEGHLNDFHYWTDMRVDERQTGEFLLERPQRRQRLMRDFRLARINSVPRFISRAGNLVEKGSSKALHFLVEAGFRNGFGNGVIHERGNPVQLP